MANVQERDKSKEEGEENSLIQRLLKCAHGSSTAQSIYADTIQHRPLFLHPTTIADQPADARAARQKARAARDKAKQRRRRRPVPLSAKDRRRLGLHDIPKEHQTWDIFEPVYRLWLAYIHHILSLSVEKKACFDIRTGGAILAAADFHGALLEVVKSRCVGRVGIKGIVTKETRGTFQLITRNNDLKIIPKECSVFRLEVPLLFISPKTSPAPELPVSSTPELDQKLVFELYGSQLLHRPAERATKKIKMHLLDV